MSIIKVDTIKDETGANTLVTQSGSNFAWGAGVPKGSVIEQFCSPCDGSAITVQSGTYTVQTVSAYLDVTTSYQDITGSSIAYNPPTGTQTVVYEFTFAYAYQSDRPILSFKYWLDSAEVTNARRTISYNKESEGFTTFKWSHNIGGSTTTATGRTATWSGAKTMKMQVLEFSSSYQGTLHQTEHWEASGTNQFAQPIIGITALA